MIYEMENSKCEVKGVTHVKAKTQLHLVILLANVFLE